MLVNMTIEMSKMLLIGIYVIMLEQALAQVGNCRFPPCFRTDSCEFRCDNGACLTLASWICDGIPDCINLGPGYDDSDERNCPYDCFTCDSGYCISRAWQCDGIFEDCYNGEDERNCSGRYLQQDCSEYLAWGNTKNGLYKIRPHYRGHDDEMVVYCDMESDGGGWTVIQRRLDGAVDFYKNWIEYQNGFGYLDGEFWLGNDKISYITDQGTYELRVDMTDVDSNTKHAVYSSFRIDRDDDYRLYLGSYSGTAGNSLIYHDLMQWSTYDHDNDLYWEVNCAEMFSGAFWYNNCFRVNINRVYGTGVHWYNNSELTFTEMKIRRIPLKNEL